MARAEFRIGGGCGTAAFSVLEDSGALPVGRATRQVPRAVYTRLVVVLGLLCSRADTLGQAGAIRGHVYREPD